MLIAGGFTAKETDHRSSGGGDKYPMKAMPRFRICDTIRKRASGNVCASNLSSRRVFLVRLKASLIQRVVIFLPIAERSRNNLIDLLVLLVISFDD